MLTIHVQHSILETLLTSRSLTGQMRCIKVRKLYTAEEAENADADTG